MCTIGSFTPRRLYDCWTVRSAFSQVDQAIGKQPAPSNLKLDGRAEIVRVVPSFTRQSVSPRSARVSINIPRHRQSSQAALEPRPRTSCPLYASEGAWLADVYLNPIDAQRRGAASLQGAHQTCQYLDKYTQCKQTASTSVLHFAFPSHLPAVSKPSRVFQSRPSVSRASPQGVWEHCAARVTSVQAEGARRCVRSLHRPSASSTRGPASSRSSVVLAFPVTWEACVGLGAHKYCKADTLVCSGTCVAGALPFSHLSSFSASSYPTSSL